MAATIVSGLTNVSLVNDNTSFSVWKRDGTGGTPSAISETDVFLQGTGACSVKVSNQGVVLAYSTGGIDLSATDTHVYIWVNMLAGGLMTNRSNATPGLGIFIGYDASISGTNYDIWAVDGADTYPGGWVRYVIDVSKTATIANGTPALSSVDWIGMYCDTRPNVAKFDNLVIDRIDYTTSGTGLRVYGTSTADDTFQDILDADEGTVNNKYGVVTSKEGVIYVRGSIELGDDVSTNACNLTDIDKTVVFETPTYYDGTAEANCMATNFQQLKIVGNGTGSTTVQLGKKVGTGDTATGRNGLSFIQTGSQVTMDFDDGNANSVLIYGSKFQDVTGGLTWGTSTSHECTGNTFTGCDTFDPVGGIVIRDCNFVGVYDDGTADASNRAALLWNDSIDIKNSKFIANTHSTSDVAHGVEHTSTTGDATGTVTTQDLTGITLTDSGASFLTTAAVNDIVFNETDGSDATVVSVDSNSQITTDGLTGGTDNDFASSDAYSVVTPITYSDLTFSGNEKDIWNNKAGGNGLAISKTGTSNPITSTNQTDIKGAVTLTWTVIDSSGAAISGALVSAYLTSDDTEIINTTTNGSGIATTSYTGSTPASIYYRIRKSSPGTTRYFNDSASGTIASGTGFTVERTLREDTIAST